MTTHTDNVMVNGTRHAIHLLEEQLRYNISLNDGVITKIIHNRTINNVTNLETLDDLILWNKTVAVLAVDWGSVSSIFLAATVISALDNHF